MAQNKTYVTQTIVAAGITKSYDAADAIDIYNLTPSGGAVALVGDVIITATGTLSIGTTYTFKVAAGFTLGAQAFTIMGVALTAAQCLYETRVNCYYNGTTWEVHICADEQSGNVSIDGGRIVTGTIVSGALVGNIVNTKLAPMAARGYIPVATNNGAWSSIDAKTSGQFLLGNGTDVVSLPISGDATVAATGVMTIANLAVTAAKIAATTITPAKLTIEAASELINIAVSFETGEVGAIKIKMPYAGTFKDVYAIATKALAATDAGTVIFKNNAGTTMTVTTPISFAASDAYGTAYTSAITANNTFIKGDIIIIQTAKATVGGKALLSFEILRS